MDTTNEDNTAVVAKQVKQAVKKYVSGKLTVRSKGGKSRFIMVRADKIDNKLRKMILDIEAPTANVRDKNDISYGNISDRIISASVDVWVKALGLKEDTNMRSFTQFTEERTFKKGDRVVGRRGNFKGEEAKVVNYDWRLGELTVAVAGKKVRVTPSDWNKIRESFSLDESESVELLDESLVLASDNLNIVKKTAQKLAKQSPDLTYYVVKHNERYMKGMKYAYYEVYQSVDMHLVRNTTKKIAGYGAKVDMRESVELGESASRETETAKKIAKTGKKLGDWVGKSYYEYEGNLWILGGYGSEAVNRGPINKAKKTLNKSLLKKLKFNESVELDEAGRPEDSTNHPKNSQSTANILKAIRDEAKRKAAEEAAKKTESVEHLDEAKLYAVHYKFKGGEHVGAAAVGSQTGRTGLLNGGKKIDDNVFELRFDKESDFKKFERKYRGVVLKKVSESVELDEAHHDQRAADKALFNAMKVVDPKARWKMVKTDPSRFGVDVEITSQKMAKYGDWTLMAWSDGKLMHLHYDHPNGEGSVPEKDFKRIAKDMMKESVNKYTQEQQGHLMPKLSGLPGPRPFNNKKNESVELGEAINRGNEAFWKEIHIELKKVMDNKYYREFRSSNGGQALDNVISHFGKARGWRVDRVVKEIIDKYGRNRDEYIKLSFAMAARSRIKESTQIDEKVMGAAYPKGHPMRKFETPASPQTKKLIEGGKAKILKQVTSVLGDTTKFVVIENPTGAWHTGGNQDKVLMATISDPKRGRIKMFAFHGSHISIAKAMQFAINNKLVVTTKMESVELDEKVDGWIAIYNRKKLEIPNDGKVKGILGAKQLAIKHFKVPKSKQGMLAIKPATNESTEHEDTKPDMSKPIAATVDEIVARAAEAIGRGKAFGGWTDSVEKVKNDITADEDSPDSPEV